MAVPWCWLEKTGISAAFSRWSATVKARGAETSSMQIAPKVGAMARPTLMMSSGRLLLTQIGKASMPAKVLKMTLLPSAIGRAASAGPISRPKISEPSVRIATVLPRQVRSNEESASWLIARQASATPGV
jgi:hypothetical protein